MKILLSAYACEPEKGSEPGIGFRTLLALAADNDVWLLTRANNVKALTDFLATDEAREARVRVIGFDLSKFALRLKRLGPLGLMWYYDRWQKKAGHLARTLDIDNDFDVVHHVTLAAYWMRTGLADVSKPMIWGPVGGAVQTPWRLTTELGIVGFLTDAARYVGRRILMRVNASQKAQREAAYIFVNNTQTAKEIRTKTGSPIEVLPNPLAVIDLAPPMRGIPRPEILFAGRLLPWKGAKLAIRAMRYVAHSQAHLSIIGTGPDRQRLARLIRRWKLDQKVALVGSLPRAEVLRRMSESAVLLHPALHEEGGNVIAEALGMGIPVVCLDHGGPSQTIRHFSDVPSVAVVPTTPRNTARNLGRAIDSILDNAVPRTGKTFGPSTNFAERVLRAAESVAQGQAELLGQIHSFDRVAGDR